MFVVPPQPGGVPVLVADQLTAVLLVALRVDWKGERVCPAETVKEFGWVVRVIVIGDSMVTLANPDTEGLLVDVATT